ncbi:MAG: hypothetical protein WBN68_18695 [Sedimenticolaceae bacterium]
MAVVDHQCHRLTTGGLQTNLGTGVLALNQRKGDIVQDLGVSHSDTGEGLGVEFEDNRGNIRDHVSGAGLARQQFHLPDDIALP